MSEKPRPSIMRYKSHRREVRNFIHPEADAKSPHQVQKPDIDRSLNMHAFTS